MKRKNIETLSDDELHALVDGQGAPEILVALGARLHHDPEAQIRLTHWTAQRDAMRHLYQEVLTEPVSSTLLRATQSNAQTALAPARVWWRYGGVAASFLLMFACGWLGHLSWTSYNTLGAKLTLAERAQAAQSFVHQASLAHSVYVPELRHPVEVGAPEQAHLVQWLSKRLGRPLKVPNLTAQGFELVGGRLLPGDAGARAQFMFQNAAGTRVTLYLGGLPAAAQNLANKDTAFRFETQAGVPSFYWIDQGFGYALSGQVPRETLRLLADAAYRQL